MARLRKFPITHTNKEIPYDCDGFIRWCVSHECLAASSARQYALDLQTAYLTVFEDECTIFEDLKSAFTPRSIETVPKEWRCLFNDYSLLIDKWADMEDEYDNLLTYLWDLEDLEEEITIDTANGESALIPKEIWVRAFQVYARYIRWKIDDVYSHNHLPVLGRVENWEFIKLPLNRQFRNYLRIIHKKQDPKWGKDEEGNIINENAYQGQKASYTYISRLTKVYNTVLLRHIPTRVISNIDRLLRLKVPLWKYEKHLLRYINHAKDEVSEGILKDVDIAGAKQALPYYMNFMKSYSEEPTRYNYSPIFKRNVKSVSRFL